MKQRAVSKLQEIYWSDNLRHYKVSAGLMSQMLKISISPWCRELLESHVSSKLKSIQPEVAKDQQQTQASAGLFGSIYSYFTEPSKSPRNES